MIILASGCISDNADLGRISKRPPFIVHFGAQTQFISGANFGDDRCEDIVVDRYENIICTGYTNQILGGTPVVGGVNDAVIVKLDRTGNLLWIYQLGASGADACSGLVVDNGGNIFCSGDVSSAVGTLVHGSGGGVDAFILKLNSQGDLQWISRFGSVSTDYCTSLTSDRSGNLYCGGLTAGDLGNRIDNGGTETNGGSQDAFIAKLGPSGNLSWITQLGSSTKPIWQFDGTTIGAATGAEHCRGVVVDPSGAYVYCSGPTTGALGEPNLSVAADTDIFFLRLNTSDGKDPRSIQYGLFTNNIPLGYNYEGVENCRKLTSDSLGNLYCIGITNGSIGDTLSGASDVVIAKVNAGFTKGPILQLGLTQFTPYGDPSGADDGRDIIVDRQNNLVITGITSGNFGETHGGGGNDIFAMKLTPSGVPLWVRHFGQDTMGTRASGTENAFCITSDTDNNIYLTGQTGGDFGETPAAANDILVIRLRPDGSL